MPLDGATPRRSRARAGAIASVFAILTCLAAGLTPTAALAAPTAATAAVSKAAPAKNAGAGFGIQPASATGPIARSGFTYSATPGGVVSDHVAVVNLGLKPVTVQIYATDATSTPTGAFTLVPAAQKPRDLGTWITIDGPPAVTVPGRVVKNGKLANPTFVIVPFKVAVPSNAGPGDHAGGIVVSLQGFARNAQGVTVKLDQRVASRVYVRVSGTVHAALIIRNLGLNYTGPALLGSPLGDGRADVSYTVTNSGNVILGATQRITISSWLGSTIAVKSVPLVPPLLPGTSVTVHERVKAVFAGVLVTAKVQLTPVAPPGGNDPNLNDVSASTSTWAFPWELIVLVLLVLIGIGALAWRIRHNRKPNPNASNSHRRPVRVGSR
jgi:hypothetical protein